MAHVVRQFAAWLLILVSVYMPHLAEAATAGNAVTSVDAAIRFCARNPSAREPALVRGLFVVDALPGPYLPHGPVRPFGHLFADAQAVKGWLLPRHARVIDLIPVVQLEITITRGWRTLRGTVVCPGRGQLWKKHVQMLIRRVPATMGKVVSPGASTVTGRAGRLPLSLSRRDPRNYSRSSR